MADRVKYTSQVIGDEVVLATTKLVMEIVPLDTVVSVDADVPTFLATYEVFAYVAMINPSLWRGSMLGQEC